tara:strand:- start:5644 stop:6090 length:447 start_codon:yes stop_codon:yes gene_type:complete
MANVINRTTLRYLTSVNSPSYPAPDWVVNPDMRAVAGVSPRYWKWDSGSGRPIPMTASEQTAFDAAAVEATRDEVAAQIDSTEDILRAVMGAVISELNNQATAFNAVLAAADAATSLSTFRSGMAAIGDLPQRSLSQLRTVVRNALGT